MTWHNIFNVINFEPMTMTQIMREHIHQAAKITGMLPLIILEVLIFLCDSVFCLNVNHVMAVKIYRF